ncbi:hypothetical protein LP316_12480 [Thalassotalea sp. LPB0316]|uniref:hypothetical protein n=1 Tax=Thalassotalea sp. LPB0316 TaxID=2769490 RepID=UPI00186635D9|nr:hypothetical protein [Thalassotalea sp. LPB0316]QOL25110.1 hypothetical protein LP316_12480 [Thalassotalea sp. LPB0316]
MNKHIKIAIFVAPFLLLGGYIATDMYLENDAKANKVFKLEQDGHCDVYNRKCILTTGEMQVSIEQHEQQTVVNTTYPIDEAILFVVNNEQDVDTHKMTMRQTPYYWQTQTTLPQKLAVKGDSAKLRIIVKYQGDQYIAQFYSQTVR